MLQYENWEVLVKTQYRSLLNSIKYDGPKSRYLLKDKRLAGPF
jgi:hypothetical protein